MSAAGLVADTGNPTRPDAAKPKEGTMTSTTATPEPTVATTDNDAKPAFEAPRVMRFEGTTKARVSTKANGRTKDHIKLAMSSEGAVRGGHLRDYLANGGNVKEAAAALNVSVTRIRALVDGPTIKARYALRVNPEAVFKGMTADELDSLRALLDDMGAGETA